MLNNGIFIFGACDRPSVILTQYVAKSDETLVHRTFLELHRKSSFPEQVKELELVSKLRPAPYSLSNIVSLQKLWVILRVL